jgi:hypothetical protein
MKNIKTTYHIIMDLERLISELKKNALEEKEEELNYHVNWNEAPNWAEFHAYDECGVGHWYGPHIKDNSDFFSGMQESGWEIGISVMHIHKKNWKSSIVPKPLIF